MINVLAREIFNCAKSYSISSVLIIFNGVIVYGIFINCAIRSCNQCNGKVIGCDI